ncbi:MAG: divergent polysaccharide deacetylase family protein [Bacillaceae bacterium]
MKKVNRWVIIGIAVLIVSILQSKMIISQGQAKSKLAIVIDDFGNNGKGTNNMFQLPIPLTVAVMPFLPNSKEEAIKAHQLGKEVIIHLPMESISANPNWYGPRPILTSMSDEEIKAILYDAINEIPFAVGINNHMGSKATADERIMRVILSICKEKGFFFLNSRTNASTVAQDIAKNLHVPYLENELFFDHYTSYSHVTNQANLLLKKLDEDQQVIIIGHVGSPGEITSSVIKNYISQFQQKAEIVTLSQLLKKKK